MMTKEEKAWVRKVQKLLDQCPPRLGFFTIGDPDLIVFDRDKEHLFDDTKDFPGEVEDHDAHLTRLGFPCPVHGVRG